MEIVHKGKLVEKVMGNKVDVYDVVLGEAMFDIELVNRDGTIFLDFTDQNTGEEFTLRIYPNHRGGAEEKYLLRVERKIRRPKHDTDVFEALGIKNGKLVYLESPLNPDEKVLEIPIGEPIRDNEV